MNPEKIKKHLFTKFIFSLLLVISLSPLYAQDNATVSTSKYSVREDADGDGVKNRKEKYIFCR